jgi:glycyl-tRNA synthetase beta chain
MPASVLFEIGCEEIPAKMLAKALVDLPASLAHKLDAKRLTHGGISAVGTPRRLAVIITQLAERQPDLDEEIVGPPVSAAFAPDGSRTKAGAGWAAKNGVDASAVAKREVAGKKGQYAVARRHVAGAETRQLPPDLLRELAAGIAWPKSMRWGWSETTFVRPVQWLVALYGGEVLPLSWAGQTAGRETRGHRFLSPGAHAIVDAGTYIDTLRELRVIVDPAERRVMVVKELEKLAADSGLRMRPDEALVSEVIHLGEFPVGISGRFDPAFLEVPEEMIVTAMRTHQRYFAFEDAHGTLAPRFATIAATQVADPGVVAKGNQKVLASRLSDAKFFFGEDRKHTFDEWNAKLDGVVFQAKLGDGAKTIGDKVRRLVALVERVGGSKAAVRAAQLCKADLASQAVGEFPELQGVMGKHYARFHKEPGAVADAIEQHWWPKGQGAALPESDDAALVALADRMDTLVGCFATGLVPTGSADPFGLRRAAVGVLTILLERPGIDLDTWSFAEATADGYATLRLSDDARTQLAEFFAGRLRAILIDDRGLEAQAVDCALGAASRHPRDVLARATLLQTVPAGSRVAFKRIGNILDSANPADFDLVNEDRFTAQVERDLWGAFRTRQDTIRTSIETSQYSDAIHALAELNPQLSAFFDKGGVGGRDDNRELRANRLGLLSAIYSPFKSIGDFRKLGGAS